MRNKWHLLRWLTSRWSRAEEGVAATEYAIMLALIVMGSMGIIRLIGEKFAVLYTMISSSLPEGFG